MAGPGNIDMPAGGVRARLEELFCDIDCGIDSSNSSARSKDEYVWFASSTAGLSVNANSCKGMVGHLLFWKFSSVCDVRFDLDGVAGEPSSCSK